MNPEFMHASLFRQVIHDSKLVQQRKFAIADIDIVYTMLAKGKRASSGKMNFDEFLSALVAISCRLHPKKPEYTAYTHLLRTFILPHCKRWPTNEWGKIYTTLVEDEEVIKLFLFYSAELWAIFAFYARYDKNTEESPHRSLEALTPKSRRNSMNETLPTEKHVSVPKDHEKYHLEFTSFVQFCQDFGLPELSIKAKDFATIFIGASFYQGIFVDNDFARVVRMNRSSMMSLSGFDLNKLEAVSITSEGLSDRSSTTSMSNGSIATVEDSRLPAFSGDRNSINFSQFCDTIGRAALLVFPKVYRNLSLMDMVKGILWHMGRAMDKAKVLEIIKNRHEGRGKDGFTQGVLLFNKKLHHTWRRDGSKDYLTGEVNFHSLAT